MKKSKKQFFTDNHRRIFIRALSAYLKVHPKSTNADSLFTLNRGIKCRSHQGIKGYYFDVSFIQSLITPLRWYADNSSQKKHQQATKTLLVVIGR